MTNEAKRIPNPSSNVRFVSDKSPGNFPMKPLVSIAKLRGRGTWLGNLGFLTKPLTTYLLPITKSSAHDLAPSSNG